MITVQIGSPAPEFTLRGCYANTISLGEAVVMDSNAQGMVKLDLKSLAGKRLEGIYPYVASPKTGTSATSEIVDILLLSGSSDAYPNGSNYYLKVGKDYILQQLS